MTETDCRTLCDDDKITCFNGLDCLTICPDKYCRPSALSQECTAYLSQGQIIGKTVSKTL